MKMGILVVGICAVVGAGVWFFMRGGAPRAAAPAVAATTPKPSAAPKPVTAPKPFSPVVNLDRPDNLTPECSAFVKKVVNSDVRAVWRDVRMALQGGPEVPAAAKSFTTLSTLKSSDKCGKIPDKHPLSKYYAAYAKACGDLATKTGQDRVFSAATCFNAMRDMRIGTVEELYRGVPVDKIADPGVLTVLLEGSMQTKSDATPARNLELARELARKMPNSVEAATLEMQASYLLKFANATQGDVTAPNTKEVEEAIEKMERLDPENPRLQDMKLEAIGRSGDSAKLAENAQRLKSEYPDSDAGPFYLAMSHFLKNDRQAAVGELMEYGQKHPYNPRVNTALSALGNAPPDAKVDDVFADQNLIMMMEQFENDRTTGELVWQRDVANWKNANGKNENGRK